LDQDGKVNTILIARRPGLDQNERNKLPETINTLLREKATLEDLGLNVRALNDHKTLSVESSSNIIDDSVARAVHESAAAQSLQTVPIISYLANSISWVIVQCRIRSSPVSPTNLLCASPTKVDLPLSTSTQDGRVLLSTTGQRGS
jgi:hypothetical protein